MDRALREPQPLGEIADADLVMVFGERLDQPQRVRDRGKPGAGLCDARFPLRSGRGILAENAHAFSFPPIKTTLL